VAACLRNRSLVSVAAVGGLMLVNILVLLV
jgi:hypothetical protein